MSKSPAVEDLFFHPVHGMCRLAAVIKSPGSKEVNYSFLQVTPNIHTKIRFTVPQEALKESGFNKAITARTASAIIEYLKSGEKKKSQTGAAWASAEMVRSESMSKEPLRFAQRRNILERAVKGLVDEVAFVLKCSSRKAALMAGQNLKDAAPVNPLVQTLLNNIDPFREE